jgi:hypothetical protein
LAPNPTAYRVLGFRALAALPIASATTVGGELRLRWLFEVERRPIGMATPTAMNRQ